MDHDNNTLPALLIVFGLVLFLGMGGWLAYEKYINKPKILPADSFSYAIRLVEEKKPDGTIIRYYVLDTTNLTKDPVYNCTISLISKGTQDKYDGFLSSYVLDDCKKYTDVRGGYDCRLGNTLKRWLSYVKVRTIKKIVPNGTAVIGMDSFYTEQTTTPFRFTAKYKFSDIYSYQALCKSEQGRKIFHEKIN